MLVLMRLLLSLRLLHVFVHRLLLQLLHQRRPYCYYLLYAC